MDDEPLGGDARLTVVEGSGRWRPPPLPGPGRPTGRTMNGSLPPSSRTDFFTSSPAMEATDEPAGPEPVRVTATTRSSRMTASTFFEPMSRVWKAPSGKPARRNSSWKYDRGLGDVGGVLEQPDVAGHQGRRGEAHDLPQREVPGHDGQDRPERLVAGVRRRWLRRRRHRPARRPETPRRGRRSSDMPGRISAPPGGRRPASCPSPRSSSRPPGPPRRRGCPPPPSSRPSVRRRRFAGRSGTRPPPWPGAVHLVVGELGEYLECLAGGRVDAADCHGRLLASLGGTVRPTHRAPHRCPGLAAPGALQARAGVASDLRESLR